MKSKGRKVGRRYRNAKMLTTLHAKQGKDRSRQNRQDRQTEKERKRRLEPSGETRAPKG